MSRFVKHPHIPFHALLEPAQDALREALLSSQSPVALVVHDWCMFGFNTHTSKRDRLPIHVIDREADSVGHYRQWQSRGHRFLVRADQDRLVLWKGRELKLSRVVGGLSLEFRDVTDAKGQPEIVTIQAGTGRVRVAETEIVLHRPAKQTVTGEKTAGGNKKKIDVAGPPIRLRLIVTRVVDENGKVVAEW